MLNPIGIFEGVRRGLRWKFNLHPPCLSRHTRTTLTHSHAHTHTLIGIHAHTHTLTHSHAHTHTYTLTHAHTHSHACVCAQGRDGKNKSLNDLLLRRFNYLRTKALENADRGAPRPWRRDLGTGRPALPTYIYMSARGVARGGVQVVRKGWSGVWWQERCAVVCVTRASTKETERSRKSRRKSVSPATEIVRSPRESICPRRGPVLGVFQTSIRRRATPLQHSTTGIRVFGTRTLRSFGDENNSSCGSNNGPRRRARPRRDGERRNKRPKNVRPSAALRVGIRFAGSRPPGKRRRTVSVDDNDRIAVKSLRASATARDPRRFRPTR